MPIVLLSVEDDEMLKIARMLGKQYGEKVFKFETTPAKNTNTDLQEFTFENLKPNERITLYGHSFSGEFGQQKLTENALVEQLKKRGLPKDREIIMDFLGCEIAKVTNESSYVNRVANLLQKEGYDKVKINAFTSLATQQELVSVAVTFNKTWEIHGIPRAHKKALDKAKTTLKKYDEMLENLQKQLIEVETKRKQLDARLGELQDEK
ncbi:MAG: hypothetical protein ACYCQI_13310 [Gammaproteobacteria bacterium]